MQTLNHSLKRSFMIGAALFFSAMGAQATTTFTIVLDNPDQTIAPGGTAQFFGTIYNNTAGTINITSDDLNLFAPAPDFTVTDQFNANVPFFIDGGLNSGDIELFDLTAALPFPDTLLVAYSGLYDLTGGPNVGDQTILNDATAFSVTVSPEPGTLGLTGGALVGLCALLRRRKAHLNTLRKQ